VRRRVVITDVTRMAGERVCVAGYTRKAGQPESCVRPLFRYGDLTEQWLCARSGVIRPFAVVEFDLLTHKPGKPHSEDWLIEPRLRIVQELLSPEERLAFLRAIEDAAVREVFGTEVYRDEGWYVQQGHGTRSLGTVRASSVDEVVYRQWTDSGKWAYRIAFRDDRGDAYRLTVTDLAFRLYLDSLRDNGASPASVARSVRDALNSADHAFLRIGLARGWEKFPDRCHLQVTGVYSSPDYLAGKCFADFRPFGDDPYRTLSPEDVPF
jgi:hypothetical protein